MSSFFVRDHLFYKQSENGPVPLSFQEILASDAAESFGYRIPLIPASASVEFSFSSADNSFSLVPYFQTAKFKEKIPVLDKGFSDYYADEEKKKIYPIPGSAVINDVLKENNIHDAGHLLLSEYLFLSRKGTFPGIEILNNLSGEIESVKKRVTARPASFLMAHLFPYQQTGFAWLYYMVKEKCGCILGDEMGLGKTLQIIALVAKLIEDGNRDPVLIVAPVTLLENWKREFAKFAPSIKTYVYYADNRTYDFEALSRMPVVITAYSTVTTDFGILQNVHWKLLVLDEAQNIKNPAASRTKAVKSLNREVGIAVTGTPFQNHLDDVWSLMDFIYPGYLGSKREFEAEYTDDEVGAEELEPLVSPFLLRRLVKDVGSSLPEKVEIPENLKMSPQEASVYDGIRNDILAHSDQSALIFSLIAKLRQYCTHPCLYDGKRPQDLTADSIKYQRLVEILEEIRLQGEKALVFTSYVTMIRLMKEDLQQRFRVPCFTVSGETPVSERQKIIDEFSRVEGACFLILNPLAAGTGLNITSANHVIHYNLDWNPANEDQATARAFRTGQKKTVFVHRLFYVNTIEEYMNEKIEHKREMGNEAIVGTSGENTTVKEILEALKLTPEEEQKNV